MVFAKRHQHGDRLGWRSATKNPWFYISMFLAALLLWKGQQNCPPAEYDITLQESRIKSLRKISKQGHHYYKASAVEDYVFDHATELGYDQTDERKNFKDEDSNRPVGCAIFTDPNVAKPIFDRLARFRSELKDYSKRIHSFVLEDGIQDVRLALEEQGDDVCNKLELHPNGLPGIFRSEDSLSLGASGYVEPLLPPLRDPEFCFEREERLLSLNYLIHDFAYICRHKLKPKSRTIFVDMGASLDFHDHENSSSPAVYITSMYKKFGIVFDHIYAYEVTRKEPSAVYDKIPNDWMGSYHWINVGVSAGREDHMNPLKMLLDHYNEDDFIVIKLDIDTSSLEMPLARQLLEDKRLHKLVDAFYFEHHVHMKDIQGNWKTTMDGTLADSLKLFRKMRETGIAAHYWV